MSDDENYWRFNPNLPTVTGFLGAITFTALILMIQFASEIQFAEILISLTASVSFLFIISTLGGSVDEANSHLITSKLIKFVSVCFTIGIVGMFVILPLLIFSYSLIGFFVLIVIEVIGGSLYFKYIPRASSNDQIR